MHISVLPIFIMHTMKFREKLTRLLKFSSARKFCVGLFILLFSIYACAGIEDRRFESVRLHLVEQIDSILIKSRLCMDVADCRKSQILFASPINGGVSIQVWSDINANTLELILKVCSDSFFGNEEIKQITIKTYNIKKQEALSMPIWKIAKPSSIIIYRRIRDVKR